MQTLTTCQLVYNAVVMCAVDRKDCSAGGIFDAYVENGGKPKAFGEVFLALQRMEREERIERVLQTIDGNMVQWWFAKTAAVAPNSEMRKAA